MPPDDSNTSIGILSRQEILTYLMIFVFGAFAVTFTAIMVIVFSNPKVVEQIIVSGEINLGTFIDGCNNT